MQTGGNYPIENTKEICGNLPFKIENAVFKTAHWMYKKDFIKHKPEEIISEKIILVTGGAGNIGTNYVMNCDQEVIM